MAVTARTSGRVVRNIPLGALPTGVRTADTITASFIEGSPSLRLSASARASSCGGVCRC